MRHACADILACSGSQEHKDYGHVRANRLRSVISNIKLGLEEHKHKLQCLHSRGQVLRAHSSQARAQAVVHKPWQTINRMKSKGQNTLLEI